MRPMALASASATRECPGARIKGCEAHFALVGDFGSFSSGKPKQICNRCLEVKRIRDAPYLKRAVEKRAEVARADADANPEVLDVERPAAQREIIVNTLMALPLFTELPATTSLLVYGTARFGIGAPWPEALKLLWTEGASSFQYRNYYPPAILKSDKTTVTKEDLQKAGWQLQLLYVSDRITDATGNVNSGEGAIEGRIIRKCEEALGITAEVRDGPEYRASTHSKGRLVNKSASAKGWSSSARPAKLLLPRPVKLLLPPP